MLKFSTAKTNRKLQKLSKALGISPKDIWTFSLPSGWSCPGANICKSKFNPKTNKIEDGPKCKFRCYSASMEALSPALRNNVWHNFDLLRKTKNKEALILGSLPDTTPIVRLHVCGDFFNKSYFDAWVKVAWKRPDTIFYGYTKSAVPWLYRTPVPPNFRIVLSHGGKHDDLIEDLSLPKAYVIFNEEEAGDLPIDEDDSHAYHYNGSFCLMIHGIQPKKQKENKNAHKPQHSCSD